MFLGIDGGATETAGAILDSDGSILGFERARASAIIGRPSAESCAVLRAIVEGLCRRAGVAREGVSGPARSSMNSSAKATISASRRRPFRYQTWLTSSSTFSRRRLPMGIVGRS